jgi:hypothetical protein
MYSAELKKKLGGQSWGPAAVGVCEAVHGGAGVGAPPSVFGLHAHCWPPPQGGFSLYHVLLHGCQPLLSGNQDSDQGSGWGPGEQRSHHTTALAACKPAATASFASAMLLVVLVACLCQLLCGRGLHGVVSSVHTTFGVILYAFQVCMELQGRTAPCRRASGLDQECCEALAGNLHKFEIEIGEWQGAAGVLQCWAAPGCTTDVGMAIIGRM